MNDTRFIFFTDEDQTEIAVPINRITGMEFKPEDEKLTVYVEDGEYYEVEGKDARKAWDEIRNQIRNINT